MGDERLKTALSRTTPTTSPVIMSFAYEHRVSHIQTIRQQMFEGIKYLDDRWNNEKNIRD